MYPVHALVLVGWAVGARAQRLSQLKEPGMVCEALNALSRITSENRTRLDTLLESAHIHNWQTDPFSRGAYSYIPVGATDAPAQLARPVEDTLFFAGEATDADGREGSVHGALATGYRAARETTGS